MVKGEEVNQVNDEEEKSYVYVPTVLDWSREKGREERGGRIDYQLPCSRNRNNT